MKKFYCIMLCIIFLIIYLILRAHKEVPVSKVKIFNEYQVHFEIIKNFIVSEQKNGTYGIVYNDNYKREKIVGIYGITQTLTESEIESLNLILNAFEYDFSFIEVNKNRVAFGGDGSDMFVYSTDGKSPKWFYNRFDGINFSKEKLSGNWFYLYHHIR